MFDHPAVFSWPAIILGAIVFGFLFELIFIVFEYLVEGRVGLSPQVLIFGILAAVAYSGACVFVRWTDRKARGRRNND